MQKNLKQVEVNLRNDRKTLQKWKKTRKIGLEFKTGLLSLRKLRKSNFPFFDVSKTVFTGLVFIQANLYIIRNFYKKLRLFLLVKTIVDLTKKCNRIKLLISNYS